MKFKKVIYNYLAKCSMCLFSPQKTHNIREMSIDGNQKVISKLKPKEAPEKGT